MGISTSTGCRLRFLCCLNRSQRSRACCLPRRTTSDLRTPVYIKSASARRGFGTYGIGFQTSRPRPASNCGSRNLRSLSAVHRALGYWRDVYRQPRRTPSYRPDPSVRGPGISDLRSRNTQKVSAFRRATETLRTSAWRRDEEVHQRGFKDTPACCLRSWVKALEGQPAEVLYAEPTPSSGCGQPSINVMRVRLDRLNKPPYSEPQTLLCLAPHAAAVCDALAAPEIEARCRAGQRPVHVWVFHGDHGRHKSIIPRTDPTRVVGTTVGVSSAANALSICSRLPNRASVDALLAWAFCHRPPSRQTERPTLRHRRQLRSGRGRVAEGSAVVHPYVWSRRS